MRNMIPSRKHIVFTKSDLALGITSAALDKQNLKPCTSLAF